jgi:RNA polymerase sigma factor (sigma-70 family)
VADSTDEIDEEIVRLARAGEAQASAALMAKTYRRWLLGFVRRRARPETVDDVCAKVWLVVARKMPRDLRSPRGWLARIAFNTIGHALNARSVDELDSELAQKPMWRSTTVSVRGKLMREQQMDQVRRAIAALEPADRELIHLAFVDGLKPAEIVEATGRNVTPKTLSKQIGRIVESLQESVLR